MPYDVYLSPVLYDVHLCQDPGFPGSWIACYTQCSCTNPVHMQCNQCSALNCSAMQCSAVQCSAVQCSAVQCSAVQCSAVQCSAVQCSAVQYSAVQCSAVQCSAVQCSAVQCSVVQCSASAVHVQCSAPCDASDFNCILSIHGRICTALHCTALHCTALHCIALRGPGRGGLLDPRSHPCGGYPYFFTHPPFHPYSVRESSLSDFIRHASKLTAPPAPPHALSHG